MKISDMERVLQHEFPDVYVSFQIDIDKGSMGGVGTTIRIYTEKTKFIEAADFETCVQRLKESLNPVTRANFEVES